MKTAEVPGSAWSPFRYTVFTVLWAATVVSNIGSWMQSAAAGWLMTTLSPEPLNVALVQAATTLPMFLFSLPAGALADIVDRRRFLIPRRPNGPSPSAASRAAISRCGGFGAPGMVRGPAFCDQPETDGEP
jgi:MFS family permease